MNRCHRCQEHPEHPAVEYHVQSSDTIAGNIQRFSTNDVTDARTNSRSTENVIHAQPVTQSLETYIEAQHERCPAQSSDHGLTKLALDLLSWLSIFSRVLSVAWGSVGVGFDVRCKAPSQPGSTRSVHDA